MIFPILTDGACSTCEGLWSSSSLTFTFDPQRLGGLPTHVGLVLTDAYAADITVRLTGTTVCTDLAGLELETTFGDGSIDGGTAEDRFIGFRAPAGVTSMTVDVGGPLEVDLLQLGW